KDSLCRLQSSPEAWTMITQLEAVYENGAFHPLQPVDLPEHQRVTVCIEPASDAGPTGQAHFALPPERWQAFCEALDAPPRDLPALRKLLTETGLFDGNGNAAP